MCWFILISLYIYYWMKHLTKEEVEQKLKKKSSFSFAQYQNVTPGAFFKLKKQNSMNKVLNGEASSNPEGFAEVCDQLSN